MSGRVDELLALAHPTCSEIVAANVHEALMSAPITMDQIAALADALDVEPAWLLTARGGRG